MLRSRAPRLLLYPKRLPPPPHKCAVSYRLLVRLRCRRYYGGGGGRGLSKSGYPPWEHPVFRRVELAPSFKTGRLCQKSRSRSRSWSGDQQFGRGSVEGNCSSEAAPVTATAPTHQMRQLSHCHCGLQSQGGPITGCKGRVQCGCSGGGW
ncbi:hypothetical protein AAFF_G00129340 [Aldrovandia affinis]|uniref:Uncharacterized protein n=1 Tax=Aldrovandia affinis TaxID=143900 RepID=A0AAD7T1D9_9TELE|nr:hypothetical protein AAFF_G00129340 [Aldrovandia affinis]